MTNTFYISATESYGGTWYMLIVRDYHFCISCGSDLEKILKSLRKCVKRVRTQGRLYRELDGLDGKARVSPATYEQREEYFRAHGKDYADLVHSTVVEALQEAREEDKKNSPLRKTKSRLKKAGVIKAVAETVEERTKETASPAKDSNDSPKILRRPRVFKYK